MNTPRFYQGVNLDAESQVFSPIRLSRASLALQCKAVYNENNKTRQGYARKSILKLAGYSFLGSEK
jgi:hypothetical protein